MLYIVDSRFQGHWRMQKSLGLATAILLLAIAVTAIAQTVINDVPAAERFNEIPARGMTMEYVEANFGAPRSKRSPIGDPPITRWEYADFIVYFEYKRVIHSVAKRPIDQ